MKKYNDGISESDVLQNKFTAYLIKAVHRKRIQYLQNKFQQLNNEILFDIKEERNEFSSISEITSQLPFLEQFENDKFRQILIGLSEKDLKILKMKVLDERTFQEIAEETGIAFKTVSSIYYRLIKKLRNKLGGDMK